jgi:hypothetical protein
VLTILLIVVRAAADQPVAVHTRISGAIAPSSPGRGSVVSFSVVVLCEPLTELGAPQRH